MTDYAKAAFDLKARMNAKTKRRLDLNAFFEGVRTSIGKEVVAANAELAAVKAPRIDFRQEGEGEPTMELACGNTLCKISQDRSAPSLAIGITGETGERTITFMILEAESPFKAQRLRSPSTEEPAAEPIVTPPEIAAIVVEELILSAP